jgi:hypothetical protein
MKTKSIFLFICQMVIRFRLRQIRFVSAGFLLFTLSLVNGTNAQTSATSGLVGRVTLPEGKSAATVLISYT